MKLERGENPCPFGGPMKTNEEGQVSMPPDKSKALVAPLDVRNNIMKLSKVEKYSYKEIDGKVYRISENGVEYPPIDKKKFEAIKKLHEATFGKDEDQR